MLCPQRLSKLVQRVYTRDNGKERGMTAPSETLQKEAHVLTGSLDTVRAFEELERRRRLVEAGKTRLLSEEESFARLEARREHA